MAKNKRLAKQAPKHAFEPAPTLQENLNENPFRSLKLAGALKKGQQKAEAQEIKPTFKAVVKKPVSPKPIPSSHSSAIVDDEAEAFANAMGGVAAWDKKSKKTGKGMLKTSLASAQEPKQSHESIALEELETFKALQTTRQKNKATLDMSAVSALASNATQPKSEPERPASVYVPSAQERSRLATQRKKEAALFQDEELDDDATFVNALQNMKDVKPLTARGREIHPEVEPASAASHANDPVRDFLEGLIEFKLEFTTEYLEGHVLGLDPITIEKLRAGHYSPEAHLDLHGMNAEQAYEDLVRFFRRVYHQGLRTVLVIPGRGKNSPNGYGVLRERLQRWLTQDPFKRVVLAFCTAQINDGGAGAVYVLLRKYKKSRGKIHWDRLPTDIDLF